MRMINVLFVFSLFLFVCSCGDNVREEQADLYQDQEELQGSDTVEMDSFQELVDEEVSAPAVLNVQLASDPPPGTIMALAQGARRVNVTSLVFSASGGDIQLAEITASRWGVGDPDMIESVALMLDGDGWRYRHSGYKPLGYGGGDNKVFLDLWMNSDIAIPAGESRTIHLYVNMAICPECVTGIHSLGIDSAEDITAWSPIDERVQVQVAGDFPIRGNNFGDSSVSLENLDFHHMVDQIPDVAQAGTSVVPLAHTSITNSREEDLSCLYFILKDRQGSPSNYENLVLGYGTGGGGGTFATQNYYYPLEGNVMVLDEPWEIPKGAAIGGISVAGDITPDASGSVHLEFSEIYCEGHTYGHLVPFNIEGNGKVVQITQ